MTLPPAEAETPSESFGEWFERRREAIAGRWGAVGQELGRTRLLIKVFLLHVRYVFGYVAFGFLVSAPLQMGRIGADGWRVGIGKSLALGLLCVVPFLLLYPLTRIDWGRMRIPEFKNLELSLTRWAAIASGAFVVVAALSRWPLKLEGRVGWLLDAHIAWLNFGLMLFAWLRVKFHVVLFRDFYTLTEEDDLVLKVPRSQLSASRQQRRDQEASEEAASPSPGEPTSGAPEPSDLAPEESPPRPEGPQE